VPKKKERHICGLVFFGSIDMHASLSEATHQVDTEFVGYQTSPLKRKLSL